MDCQYVSILRNSLVQSFKSCYFRPRKVLLQLPLVAVNETVIKVEDSRQVESAGVDVFDELFGTDRYRFTKLPTQHVLKY